jgi:cyclohexa-1,5-dienecarbonyl-CoA hydratase
METKSYRFHLVQEYDGIVEVRLNRPPVNILNIEMMEEFNALIDRCSDNEGIRVLVLRSEGKNFSAGVDVAEHTERMVDKMMSTFGRMFRLLDSAPMITVAAVDGAALGGGCELATFCDIVVASERAKFGQPEVKVGVFPPVAIPIFPRLIGRGRALELLLTGDVIGAKEAERIGLITKVFPAETFNEEVAAFVSKLAGLSGSVLKIIKKCVDKTLYVPVAEGLDIADRIYLEELMKLEDSREGLDAFIEKRDPAWKHR